MCDYKQMYLHLFNAVTDAVEQLQNAPSDATVCAALSTLTAAQQRCEDIFIGNE